MCKQIYSIINIIDLMLLNRKIAQVYLQQANPPHNSFSNSSQTSQINKNKCVNVIPKSDLQSNNFYLKSEHKMRSLQSHHLGNQILQFGDKGATSRLKLRHKRYVTTEINKQDKQNHHDKPTTQEKCVHQNTIKYSLNFGARDFGYNMTAASTERNEYEEIQNYEAGTQIQAVRKNIFNGNITKRKSQDIKTPSAHVQRYSSHKQDPADGFMGKLKSKNGRNWGGLQSDRRYATQLVKQQGLNEQGEHRYCEDITLTKTRPLKHSKLAYKSISQLVQPQHKTDENDTKNYTNIERNKFNETHKRKNWDKNLISEVMTQQIITNRNNNRKQQNQQGNQNVGFDPRDTISYGRVPTRTNINRQNSQQMGGLGQQQFHNKASIKSTHTSITNITNNRVSVNSQGCRVLQSYHIGKINSNRNSKNLADEPTQSVEQQSQQSSSCQQNEEDRLQIRLGLVPRQHKGNRIKNSIDKLSDINNELDLGLKIIDDSFQISGVDDDYHHQIIHSRGGEHIANQRHDRYSNGGTSRETIRYDNNEDVIVMDQSVISPQCQQLRNQLNQVLSRTDDIGSHRHISDREGHSHAMMGSDRCYRYQYKGWLDVEEIQVFEHSMHQVQKEEEFQRECQEYGLSACPSVTELHQPNTFIEHSSQNVSQNSQNVSQNNVLLAIPVLELNGVYSSGCADRNGQLYEQLQASRDIDNDLVNTSSLVNGQMQSQMRIQPTSSWQESKQGQDLHIQTQLQKQQLYIERQCGLICSKQTYTISEHMGGQVLPNILGRLQNMLQVPLHPNYLQIYNYRMHSQHKLTIYKQPLLQSSLYGQVYSMRQVMGAGTATSSVPMSIRLNEQVVRSIAKQLLSSMCQCYKHSGRRIAVHVQDINLVQYTKYNRYKNIHSQQYQYVVKIDKAASPLQAHPQQDSQILSYNINTLIQVIASLATIADRQQQRVRYLGTSHCGKALYHSFMELAHSHTRSDGSCSSMESMLTHPYIWSDLPAYSSLHQEVSSLLC